MNREIAQKYSSYLFFDCREPFYPVRVGVTEIREEQASPLFRRMFSFTDPNLDLIVEYAIYWDYDIGHLYELEHVWVFVGKSGEVLDCEASFHGKYLKGLLKDQSNLADNTHVILYSQPGKHAFSPLPQFFELIPDLMSATNEKAGNDGLLVPDFYRGVYETSEETDRLVRQYLQNFAFTPSMDFKEWRMTDDLFVTWPQLFQEIPQRIGGQLDLIKNHLT